MNQTGVNQVELRPSTQPGQHNMWKERKKTNQRRKWLSRKEPKSNTAKERSSHQERNTQPRNNTEHQEIKAMTSRDIISMIRKGEMTYGEADEKIEELIK